MLILLIYSLIDIQKQGLVKCPGILWLNQVDMLAITYCVPVLRAPQYIENIEEELDISTVTEREISTLSTMVSTCRENTSREPALQAR